MPVKESETLLTITDLCSILKLTQRHIYRLIDNGQIPFAMKIAGSWRFRRDELYKWLETRKVGQRFANVH
jgi:excisionase family DNA binding protein